jgi:hypothetical protein
LGEGKKEPARQSLEYFWKVDNIFFISKMYIPMYKQCPMYCNTHILGPVAIYFFIFSSGLWRRREGKCSWDPGT